MNSPVPALLAPLLPTLLLSAAPAQTAGDEGLGRDLGAELELPEGLQATLWAESPQLFNPTAIDVDARGRVWVAEGVNYRKWGGRNPGREHPEGDRIMILSDRSRSGECGTATVFVQDPDLVSPLGICVLEDKVIVSCSPHVIVYTDSDGDDRPDDKQILLTGFGGHDHDHGVHSLVLAPDGRCAFTAGNAGPHLVADRSGWRLRSGSLYVGGGEAPADNKPGLVSDDGRVWTGGLVLCVGSDGTGLEVLAHNFRNPYEVALDSFGNLFATDNDDDGNESCRALWVMEGANYGFFSPEGSRTWQADRRPGQATQAAHWHQDDPGVAPAGTITGSGGPTGVAVYEGRLLAPWIGGQVLAADAGRGVVFALLPEPRGAGYELAQSVLMRARGDSADPRRGWFRPSDVAVGTEGELYVADWWDPGVGGHAMGDREGYGRILRVAPQGRSPFPRPHNPRTLQGQLQSLFSPAANVRAEGLRALRARGAAVVPTLERLLARTQDPRHRARLLYVLAGIEPEGRLVVLEALDDPAPDLRITALRALRGTVADPTPFALELAGDPSPAVRREAALALRDAPFERCAAALLEIARGYDGRDRDYLEALGIAAEGKAEELYALLADELGDKPAEWDARFAGISWRLHPPSAIPSFVARAMDSRLAPEAREQAVNALAFVSDREAAEAMLTLALAGPEDVRELASFWIQHRDANDWRAFELLSQLGFRGLEQAELRYQSEILPSRKVEIDVDVSDAQILWLVVTDGGDGNGYDWADWIEPRLVGPAGELRLTELPWLRATAQWGEVQVDRNAAGGRMQVDGEPLAFGIGTHAHSEIAWQVPEGYERFLCRAAADDGGTTQTGSRTSVQFLVYVEPAPDLAWLIGAQEELLDPRRAFAERAGRARELAGGFEGGMLLVHLAATGRLDEELQAAVAETLFRNPDITVRTLASEHFQRPLDTGPPLPPIAELAALEGDSRAGQELFFGQKALCSSCHSFRGRGGDVGPDLSSIREKYDRQALFDAILNPNAGIALGWDTWVLRTADGLLYSGFLLADGERIVLKDTRGERQVIDADEVEERAKLTISTMPDNVALGLEPLELAHLAELLLEDPAAERLLGEPVELFNGRDFSGWTHHLADPAARREDTWGIADGVLSCTGHPAGYLRTAADFTNFVLELEWRFDPSRGPGNSGVLLRMVGEDKVWPKSIEAQLHHLNAGDVWNIDRFPMLVDPARTRGRRTAKLQPSSEKPLGEWNRYRITLDRGELALEVNGVLQNTARWCEEVSGKICLQSEGAFVQFRNVRLWPIEN